MYATICDLVCIRVSGLLLVQSARADILVKLSWETQSDEYCADAIAIANEPLDLTCRFILDPGDAIETVQIEAITTNTPNGAFIFNAFGTDPAGVDVEPAYTGSITDVYSFNPTTNTGTLVLTFNSYTSSYGSYNFYAESNARTRNNNNTGIQISTVCGRYFHVKLLILLARTKSALSIYFRNEIQFSHIVHMHDTALPNTCYP